MPDTGSYVLSVSKAFGVRFCCGGACDSEDSKFGGEDVVDSRGEGRGLGLEMVYLVVILVYRMGVGQGMVVENGMGRTYGGGSRGNEEGRLFYI